MWVWLPLLLVVSVGGAARSRHDHAPSCTAHAHRQMQERFTACRSVHARAYNDHGGDICALLEQVVRGCGEVWQECHAPHELRNLERAHLEAFREQWSNKQHQLLQCPLYKEIRSGNKWRGARDFLVLNFHQSSSYMYVTLIIFPLELSVTLG